MRVTAGEKEGESERKREKGRERRKEKQERTIKTIQISTSVGQVDHPEEPFPRARDGARFFTAVRGRFSLSFFPRETTRRRSGLRFSTGPALAISQLRLDTETRTAYEH